MARYNPGTAMYPWEERFNTAMNLRDSGRFAEAIKLLESLLREGVHKRNHAAAINGQLGAMYLFELKEPATAERFLRKSVELAPAAEIASLGLFHSLMAQRRVIEALDEMTRYLVIKPGSEEYRIIQDEIRQAITQLGEAPHHQAAIRLAPPGEQASIAEFYSLLNRGNTVAGLDEMTRFLKHQEASRAYADILDGISQANDGGIIKLPAPRSGPPDPTR